MYNELHRSKTTKESNMKNPIDNDSAFQLGKDSHYEDFSQEKINSILVNCIDPDYFYNGRKAAEDEDDAE